MFIWSSLLDLLRVLLFALAHVCGGSLGGAIVVLSLIVRVALLPYTLRLAMRFRAHQDALQKLAPQLARLRRRHANDPARLARETRALYAEHGLSMIPKGTGVSAAIQGIVGGAVFQVVGSVARRAGGFLWISDLSRPDALLASVAGGLAGAATAAAGSAGSSGRVAAAVVAGITFMLAWRLSAATGLYWLASNAVGVVQSLLLRRRIARTTTA
jgi:YidC/Oxa1 family membrane protein insertase